MRILFIHSGSDLYGASRSLLRLTKRLAGEKHDVSCVLPGEGPLASSLRSVLVHVIIQHDLAVLSRPAIKKPAGFLLFLRNLFSSTFRLWRLIRTFGPDVVHTNTAVIPSAALAAALTRTTHIQHIRESFAEFGMFWRIYRVFLTKCATTIVCVSSVIAKQLPSSEKVRIIHNGYPNDEFVEVPSLAADAFRTKHGLRQGPIVGVVGRIKFHRKGQEILVQAAAMLKDKHPTMQLLIVGSPFPGNEEHLEQLQVLIRQVEMIDHVVFTGDVHDTGEVYTVLDVLVLPSCLPEPFGGVVAEAMAYGKPVIGTKSGGTEEQIEHGVTGLLVEPCDPADLSKALDILLSDAELRHAMGLKARARFHERFEFESFFEQMKRVYEPANGGLVHHRSGGVRDA